MRLEESAQHDNADADARESQPRKGTQLIPKFGAIIRRGVQPRHQKNQRVQSARNKERDS